MFYAATINKVDMMRSKNRISQLLLAALLLCGSQAFSQKTAYYLDPAAEYRLGSELYEKEKYTAAREKFENVTDFEPFYLKEFVGTTSKKSIM